MTEARTPTTAPSLESLGLSRDRPLVIVDVDEVLGLFMQGFGRFLEARGFGLGVREGVARGGGHAGDGGDVLGAGAALAFVGSADLLALEREAAAETEEADAFRAVEFMGGEREGVRAVSV